MKIIKKIDKIQTLEFLRVIAMIMIFFNHVWAYIPYSLPDFGARGVEIFIVLSGFLLTYNYYDKIGNKSIKESLVFAIKRIKKYWVLHIITLGLMAILSINSLATLKPQIPNILANAFLLQSWIPNSAYYWGFNGVSWFLSSLLFCYFMFPFIIKLIHKLETGTKKIFGLILLVFIMLFVQSLYVSPDIFGLEPGYVFHILPLYKVIEFSFGCLAGALFLQEKKTMCDSKIGNPIVALLIYVLYIVALFACKDYWSRPIFLSLSTLLIIVSACSYGFMNKFFSSKIFKMISSVSFEFYLIHHVVVIYYGIYIGKLFDSSKVPFYVNVIIMFVVSLILSIIYSYLKKKVISLFKKNN